MYDSYPQHDVPQNNLIQRFFSQRWSAIVIEILMTIVITVAAGSAFDIFDPFDKPADPAASSQVALNPALEIVRPGIGVPLRQVERIARHHIERERYARAAAAVDLLYFAKPERVSPIWYLEIAQFYVTVGESKKAAVNYQRYFEIVGKNADLVAQSG